MRENRVYVYTALYIGSGSSDAIEKGVIVLSQHLFDADERVFCRDVLHELVHAAGFDENMADELTDALSEKFPETIASGEESSRTTGELIEKSGVTCIFLEKEVEKATKKGIDPVTKLKQHALPLKELLGS